MPKTRRYAVRFYPGQKIRTGWQLKAARILAGLKQPELAVAAGLHVKGPPDLRHRVVVSLLRPTVDRNPTPTLVRDPSKSRIHTNILTKSGLDLRA